MARARMVLVAAAVVALCARSTAGHPCTVGATTCTCVDQDGGEWDLSSLMGTFEVPTSTAWQYQVNLCGDVVPPMCAVDTGEAQVYRQNPANLICQTLSQPFDGPFDPTHPTTVEALEDGEGLAYSMAAAGTAGFQYTIRIEMTCDVEAGPGRKRVVRTIHIGYYNPALHQRAITRLMTLLRVRRDHGAGCGIPNERTW
jgi:hypothetical protein